MCGQLHHTMPGSGVLSHQYCQHPPMMRFASRSTAAKRSGSSYWKRSAASVSTPPIRDKVETM